MAVKDGLPATDFSRMNREWVKAVAEGGSGGGGLPEITEADEGKVLTVESGAAAWATAGGGGGGDILYAQLTIDDDTSIGTLSKTWAEFKAAFDAHKLIYITSEYIGDSTSKSADMYVTSSIYEEHEEYDHYYINVGNVDFETNSVNGYPTKNFS